MTTENTAGTLTSKGIINNPFTLDPHVFPQTLVSGSTESVQEIIDVFTSETPVYKSCFITGIQGSGKTVSLSFIAEHFQNQKDWIVIEFNPKEDMKQHLASRLLEEQPIKMELSKAKISVMVPGIGGFEVEGAEPIKDINVIIEKMLSWLKDINKKVLIILDDVFPSENIQSFAYDYQRLARLNFPVFLVMTGLYENLQGLQENNQLSGLSRIYRIHLAPLDLDLMAAQYFTVFQIGYGKALNMATETKGYPLAFQVLGHYTWNNGDDPNLVLSKFKGYLEECVYDKVWENLPKNDKLFLYTIAKTADGGMKKVKESCKEHKISYLSCFKQMKEKGIIKEVEGCLIFTLPYFDEYVLKSYE